MLRYAITDRALYPGGEREKQVALLHQAARWAADGINLIQLREKDLPASDMSVLAREILKIIASSATKLLINSRADVALATRAHGVHLTSAPSELTPTQIRTLYAHVNLPAPIVTVSCHGLNEVQRAREDRADAILFGPVFGKTIADRTVVPGQGLDQLHAACTAASSVPVYALGGVTLANARACTDAGAAGIAGIRLFHNLDC